MRLARDLLHARIGDDEFGGLADSLSTLTIDERHYWVGVFYTLLLSADLRRERAAYFTPPYLATAVLNLAVKYGFDLSLGSEWPNAAASGGVWFEQSMPAEADRRRRLTNRRGQPYGVEYETGNELAPLPCNLNRHAASR